MLGSGGSRNPGRWGWVGRAAAGLFGVAVRNFRSGDDVGVGETRGKWMWVPKRSAVSTVCPPQPSNKQRCPD